ncbi:MAG: ribosome silencing factor [Crocinitomicaceae bacterium TMED16]|nr:MAG: ribosome silencing factor [Crocinitomicaceae bacterium TMED16]|tara:strand:- start:32 stop:403 length:372 start_codon:yes stop_codon:yes gene_type:complete
MSKKTSKSSSEILCDAIVEGMQENKANEIVVLDLRELDGAITEFFVICSGDSDTHVDGISNSINRYVRKNLKEKPWNIEGKTNSDWVLLDYVNVVGHVFYKEKRSFYDIEELWSDATRTNIPS